MKHAKKLSAHLIYVIALCLMITSFPHKASGAGAYDMWDLGYNWARPAVSYALSKGYMEGVASNRFDPKGTVTRAQLAQVLYNLAGSPETDLSENPFSDVKTNKWYAGAIVWCLQNQVINGINQTTFAPNDPVTREQVCVMVRNFYTNYLGNTPDQPDEGSMEKFTDWPKVSGWAREAVSWAIGTGFMSGTSGTKLTPGGGTTREQLAQFLYNFDSKVQGMDITPGEETPPYNITTIKLGNKGKAKIIAHRGAGGIATENTIEAFTRSGVLSYYALECDIQRTRDGKYVVFHDPDLWHMADVKGSISNYTLKQLQGMPLYETRINKRVGGQRDELRIPTLQEYMKICKKYNKRAVLDINPKLSSGDVLKIIDIVKQENYLGKTIFISSNMSLLITLRGRLPNQTLMMNCDLSTRPEWYVSRMQEYRLGCNCMDVLLTPGLVQTMHSSGLPVGCWTVNDTAAAKRILSYGVDYLTTDILE